MKHASTDNPYELFNAALDAFCAAELPAAVALLRRGFFANLYVAPLLLGEEHHPQPIWYAGASGEPVAAQEYVSRYGKLWLARTSAVRLLREVWQDALVRTELRGFINLSRNLLGARGADLEDRLREREIFLSAARIERTQSEILARLDRIQLDLPLRKPRLGLILLASKDPAASVQFYRALLEVEPTVTSGEAGGYAELELDGVRIGIHGQDATGAGDPYALGPPPAALGWGAIFVFRVAEFHRYYGNAVSAGLQLIDSDLSRKGERYFVVKDPSGYLIEVTEEEPRGLKGER